MTPEKQQYLFDTYPDLFSARQGREPISRGIECGQGWFYLIETTCGLSQEIRNSVDRQYPDVQFSVHVLQIKEKFGNLRIYLGYKYAENLAPEQEKVVEKAKTAILAYSNFACNLSEKVCELCGAPGTQNVAGWIRTLCTDCRGMREGRQK